ncbi:glycosyltransferase N-terminal domain-containing protein [Reichenbachiella sp. MALMAid0571]|uniref:3-deoxy-D-manno-octulosonic acid transferase n=1 Tax=Reichenbachiella sp. MALMAid0571 TaxID=3143939 RepID=UPI0032DF2DBE
MSVILYNLGISTFSLLIKFASVFNPKAKKLSEGRKNVWIKLEQFSREKHNHVIWFHAASLGEFEQGRPIIEKLKHLDPSLKILLSFFSPSGYEVRKNYNGADLVVYLPADTSKNAKKFIELARPEVAVFIKYEFWYHFLKTCADNKVITLSVSSIFRKSQPFFKVYGGLHRNMLKCFDHFFVQDDYSQKLLEDSGFKNISLSGDTRFDRVLDIASQKREIKEIEMFKSGEKMMVLGSVWPSDMEVLLPFLQTYKNKLKFVIAPHNIGEKDVLEVVDQIGDGVVRFSKIGNNSNSLKDARFLIIDNMGMLSSLYGYGEYAYIGGAFRKTLHNTLEAATHGVPVFFGHDETNVKFREAGELAQTGAGIAVQDTSEMINKFEALFANEKKRQHLGEVAQNYVKNNTGATDMIVEYLKNKI